MVCDGCGTKTRKGPLSGSCDDCKYTVCEDCACHVECANFELGQGGGPECAGPDCHNRSRSVCKCFSHNFGMSYCDAMTPGLKCYWGAKGGLVYDGLKKCKAQIEMEQRFFQDESLEYIRECSFEGCEAVPKSRCGKCKSVAYCSKRHQIADWKAHKHQCGPHIEPRKAPYVSAEMRAYVERTGRYPRALPEGGIPEEKKDPVKAALERSDGKEVVPEEDGKKLYEKVKRKNRNKKAVREAFSRDVCPPVETGPEVVPLPRSGDRKPHVAPKRDPTANVEWGRPGGRGGGQQQGAGKCIRCGTTHEKLLAGGQGFSIGLACSNCAEFVAADEDTPKVEVVEQMSAEEMFGKFRVVAWCSCRAPRSSGIPLTRPPPPLPLLQRTTRSSSNRRPRST